MDENNNPNQQPSSEPAVVAAQTPTISENLTTNPVDAPQTLTEGIPVSPSPEPKNEHEKKPLVLVLAVFFALFVGLAGGYLLGNNYKKAPTASNDTKTTDVAKEELSIPQGATVIAQCAKGRGTQYALPKDIPLGPVYNVHEGKVIGIEFMVGKDELLGTAKNFLDLPLYNKRFDHVNIGLLSQGHAGFPSPHYHVDIMMVPTSVTDKITCST